MEPKQSREAIDAAYVDAWEPIDRIIFTVHTRSKLATTTWLATIMTPDYVAESEVIDGCACQLYDAVDAFMTKFLALSELVQFSYPRLGDTLFDWGPNGRYTIVTLRSLASSVPIWSQTLCEMARNFASDDKQYLNKQALVKQLEECPITESLYDQIRKRIYHEKGQLYRDHVGTIPLKLTTDVAGTALDMGEQSKILPENRSRPLSKLDAAKLLGRVGDGTKWLNQCIGDGTITCEQLTRQSFVFDITQFPDQVRSKLTPSHDK